MKSVLVWICFALAIGGGLWAQSTNRINGTPSPEAAAIAKGTKWLASVQGANGGWGQDGGETSYIRTTEHLESQGNDVANTAVAALALMRAGKQYQPNIDRAIDFILTKVEASSGDGLAVTNLQGTQIQRKLGPYIDTFLTSMLLAQVEGTVADKARSARVRQALEKTVAKIEKNQKSDGSWNVAGGWAPVLGTAMASRSLWEAQQKGVSVQAEVMVKAMDYAVNTSTVQPAPPASPGRGATTGVLGGVLMPATASASAGVPLYQSAQALEQLSRTEGDRKKNAKQIAQIQSQLADARFVEGFGSIGGEEFFSYLNISDSLKRSGGDQWKQWHSQITQKILNLQNADGTWAGSHCITGRVAVTSAAILNLAD